MKNILKKIKSTEKSGSALALTMFILAGMLMVALSGSTVILLGLKAGGIQAQSTKAYYKAESGTERILWELNQNSLALPAPSLTNPVFNVTLPEGDYQIYYTNFNPIIFTSVGEFQQTKRSVQVRM
jgi:hypothetical protein